MQSYDPPPYWVTEKCEAATAAIERRKVERRKPTVDKEYTEGLAFIKAKHFTGPITVHVHEGIPKRIVLPNPEGW